LIAQRERGYAMIAAIVGVAAFGFIAFQLIAQDRGVLAEVRGESEQAKLTAACNAGVYLALHGLADPDPTQRWGIDGRPRSGGFNGIALTITVEDERGKIPLNGIIEEEAHQLFQMAGATGTQLDTLTDSFEDWQDVDNTPRPMGAEAPYYASFGFKPRNAGFHTIGELRMIKGMTDDIYARVAPASTVFFGESGGFSEQTSQVLALEVLGEEGPTSPEVQQRIQQLAGNVPVPQTLIKASYVARTLTVRVEARENGADMKRAAIVELTGNASDPYWFRYLD
jgi:general secretion pathway protein K